MTAKKKRKRSPTNFCQISPVVSFFATSSEAEAEDEYIYNNMHNIYLLLVRKMLHFIRKYRAHL